MTDPADPRRVDPAEYFREILRCLERLMAPTGGVLVSSGTCTKPAGAGAFESRIVREPAAAVAEKLRDGRLRLDFASATHTPRHGTYLRLYGLAGQFVFLALQAHVSGARFFVHPSRAGVVPLPPVDSEKLPEDALPFHSLPDPCTTLVLEGPGARDACWTAEILMCYPRSFECMLQQVHEIVRWSGPQPWRRD